MNNNTGNNLETLRSQLSDIRKAAGMDLQTIPASSRPGWESKKRNASGQLRTAEDNLAQEIFKNSVVVAMESELQNAEATVKMIQDAEGGNYVIELDFMELENFIIKKLFSDVKGNNYSFSGSTSSRINVILSEVSIEIGALHMPPVNMPANLFGTLHSVMEARSRVALALTQTFGDDLKNYYLRKRLMDEGRKRLDHDRFAILIANTPFDQLHVAQSLITSKTVALADASPEEFAEVRASNGVSVANDAPAEAIISQIAAAIKSGGKKASKKKVDTQQ
jgi:hypothetical protein